MKKLFIIFLLFPSIVFSQEIPDSLKIWQKGGVLTLNFSQVSLTNWAAGGKSSASGVFMMNTFANYQKDNVSWDNTIDLSYGFLKENDNDLIKSNDKIDLNSKLGIKATEKWNYAAVVNFKSQFAPG